VINRDNDVDLVALDSHRDKMFSEFVYENPLDFIDSSNSLNLSFGFERGNAHAALQVNTPRKNSLLARHCCRLPLAHLQIETHGIEDVDFEITWNLGEDGTLLRSNLHEKVFVSVFAMHFEFFHFTFFTILDKRTGHN